MYASNPVDKQLVQIGNTKTGLLLLIVGALISWVPFITDGRLEVAVGWIAILVGVALVIRERESGWGHDRNATRTIIALLLIIGALVTWIPLASAVGWVIILIGTALLIKGRNGIGTVHDRNVIRSIIIFAIGAGIFIATAVISLSIGLYALLSTPLGSYSNVPDYSGPLSAIFLTAGAIVGFATVLFTYALQKTSGRVLLWTGFILAVVLTVLNMVVLTPLIYGPRGYSYIFSIVPLSSFIRIPTAMLYAIAFYLARRRIINGEIPLQQSRNRFSGLSAGTPLGES